MAELKRESGEALESAGAQSAARERSSQDAPDGGKEEGSVVGAYDALDYRLMATFPASDAVAQY